MLMNYKEKRLFFVFFFEIWQPLHAQMIKINNHQYLGQIYRMWCTKKHTSCNKFCQNCLTWILYEKTAKSRKYGILENKLWLFKINRMLWLDPGFRRNFKDSFWATWGGLYTDCVAESIYVKFLGCDNVIVCVREKSS